MTYLFVESKWTALRRNAIRYYEAVIYPCRPDEFDKWNPRPRTALNAELARISAREKEEGGTFW